jgi:AcrR family transcriptional regulator
MTKKAPRRTAQRILETTLELFNRFGEPNVPTTLICAELSMSPGNLYYHYPSKDALINALFEQYEASVDALLQAGQDVQDLEAAWFYIHTLFEMIWQHRFLYRDLNHLLSNHRRIETRFREILAAKETALQQLLASLQAGGILRIPQDHIHAQASCMALVLTWWLSFEYVRNPRQALEPDGAQTAVVRGAQHVLGLLLPYLEPSSAQHLGAVLNAYQG